MLLHCTLAPAENTPQAAVPTDCFIPGDVAIRLSPIGKEAVRQLALLEQRFPFVHIANYVIMPTHIHLLVCFDFEAAGASPRPTLPDVICAYKSLCTRTCNRLQNTPGRKLFQTSFYETIIRNEHAFQKAWEYIDGNPSRWMEARG